MGLNKIFIHRKDLSYSEVKESDSDITFIRKDALLEWAKENMEHYAILQNEKHQDPTHWGQRNAFQQMIDKLNSM